MSRRYNWVVSETSDKERFRRRVKAEVKRAIERDQKRKKIDPVVIAYILIVLAYAYLDLFAHK